jgi:hypothetical protein
MTAGAKLVVYSPGINYSQKLSGLQAATVATTAKLIDGIFVFTAIASRTLTETSLQYPTESTGTTDFIGYGINAVRVLEEVYTFTPSAAIAAEDITATAKSFTEYQNSISEMYKLQLSIGFGANTALPAGSRIELDFMSSWMKRGLTIASWQMLSNSTAFTGTPHISTSDVSGSIASLIIEGYDY